MERRWVSFFIIVLLAVLWFNLQNKKSAQQRKAAKEAREQALGDATPTPSSYDSTTTSPPVATAPAQESPSTTPTPTKAVKPVDKEPIKTELVETESYRIELTTRGAVPRSWRITDKRLAMENGEEEDEALEKVEGIQDKADREDALALLEMIPNIDNAPDREYPLEFTLKEANTSAGYVNGFNYRAYTCDRTTEVDGTQVLRFESPLLPEGLRLTKTYRFPPSGFLSSIEIELTNESTQTFSFNDDGLGPALGWSGGLGAKSKKESRMVYSGTPPSAVWITGGETEYQNENKMQIGETHLGGPAAWGGLTNRYFFAALIPQETAAGVRVSAKFRNTPAGETKKGKAKQSIEVFADPLTLAPGDSHTYSYEIYVGPKSNRILEEYGHDLDEILFFTSWRWFRGLCLLLMGLLNWLHIYVQDYGWSIILMTIIVRIVTQPFVHFGMKSNARFMRAQAKLKPHLEELGKKYKDNPQKKNEETWKLYKEHKVNPFGMLKGCFWLFLQMPIFFALYRLLAATIELRGASFLWIADLSQADQLFALPVWFPLITHLNILPIIMAGTQFLTSKLSMSSSTDPMQKQMMLMMPIMFLFIMYNISSGLVLYWIVSNVWQIGSQHLINRTVKKEDEENEAPTGSPPVKPVIIHQKKKKKK